MKPVSLDHGYVPDMASLTFAARPKRRRGDGDHEVPDSDDDEDYGWQDEDATALPPMPPQWQGSEDVLLGRDSDDGEEEEGGDSSSGSDGQGDPMAKETEEDETREAVANAGGSPSHR